MELGTQITRMSSRGQVVIPEEVREELGLHEGSVFAVFSRKETDAIVLKKLEFSEPVRAFEEIAKWGEEHAKKMELDVSPEKIVDIQHRRRRNK